MKKELKDSGALKVKSEAAQSEVQALREEVETLKKENAALKAKASEEERALHFASLPENEKAIHGDVWIGHDQPCRIMLGTCHVIDTGIYW